MADTKKIKIAKKDKDTQKIHKDLHQKTKQNLMK